jgi:hypothetical protein
MKQNEMGKDEKLNCSVKGFRGERSWIVMLVYFRMFEISVCCTVHNETALKKTRVIMMMMVVV